KPGSRTVFQTVQHKQAAGEVSPPSRSLTGPARPRRSVCAPAAMALSFYSRSALERRNLMSFFSWLQKRTWIRAAQPRASKPRPQPVRRAPRLTLEQLETRLTPSLSTLGSFLAPGGFTPYAGLIMDTSGNFYGTASAGGAFGVGTVFELAH